MVKSNKLKRFRKLFKKTDANKDVIKDEDEVTSDNLVGDNCINDGENGENDGDYNSNDVRHDDDNIKCGDFYFDDLDEEDKYYEGLWRQDFNMVIKELKNKKPTDDLDVENYCLDTNILGDCGDATENKEVSIHFAAQSGSLELLKLFLKLGQNINAKNNDGQTPLEIACQFGHNDIITFLLDNGAFCTNKTNENNERPNIFSIPMNLVGKSVETLGKSVETLKFLFQMKKPENKQNTDNKNIVYGDGKEKNLNNQDENVNNEIIAVETIKKDEKLNLTADLELNITEKNKELEIGCAGSTIKAERLLKKSDTIELTESQASHSDSNTPKKESSGEVDLIGLSTTNQLIITKEKTETEERKNSIGPSTTNQLIDNKEEIETEENKKNKVKRQVQFSKRLSIYDEGEIREEMLRNENERKISREEMLRNENERKISFIKKNRKSKKHKLKY